MKQKMRIKVCVSSEKYMKKAMQIAVVAKGVTSVAMEGEFKDEIVVIGDGVDAVSMVNALRKKVSNATLESLEEIKKKPQEPNTQPSITQPSYEQRLPHNYEVVYDSYGPGCTIM